MSETIIVIGLISVSAIYLAFRLCGLFREKKAGQKSDTSACCGHSCEGCETSCAERSGSRLHKIEILLLVIVPLFLGGCPESANTPYYDPVGIEGDPDLPLGLTNFIVIEEDEFDEMTRYGYVFLNFTASWCPPCQQMAPALESIAKKNNDRIAFIKIDCTSAEKNTKLVSRFNVESFPHYVLLYNGKEIFKHVGTFSEPDMQFNLEMAVINNDAKLTPPSGMIVIPGGPGGGKMVPIGDINPNDFVLPDDEDIVDDFDNETSEDGDMNEL